MRDAEYIERKEAKKIITEALKQRYPGVRFTARVDGRGLGMDVTYPRDAGIDDHEINDFLKQFSGAVFDGMIDLESARTHWLLPDGTVQLAYSPSTDDGQVPETRTPRPEGAVEVRLGIRYVSARKKSAPEDFIPMSPEPTSSIGRPHGDLWAQFAFDRIVGQDGDEWAARSVDAISNNAPEFALDLAQSKDESNSEWLVRSRQNIEIIRAKLLEVPNTSRKIISLPIEAQHTESATFEVRLSERELHRREATLVQTFRDYLASHGFESERNSLPVPGETTNLLTDMFVSDLNLLVEAKGVTSRSHFRMAIGQLRDYVRFYDCGPHCGILLPAPPSADLMELARTERLFVYWPNESGAFVGTDSRFPFLAQ